MSQANTLQRYTDGSDNVYTVADNINEQFAAATSPLTVAGAFQVASPFGRPPASVYANGTLAVTVKAKKPGAVRYLYFKLGSQVPTLA